MARTIERLVATTLSTLPEGNHHDGDGLYLQVRNDGATRSWLFRFRFAGKAHWMGLGRLRHVPLAEARRKCKDYRAAIRDGIDPIDARRKRKQATRIEAAKSITFKDCATRYIESHKAGWRNAKHVDQWTATLETYAYPVFGALPVQAVDTGLVTKALGPIWETKTETATRLRQRIEAVLDWARAHDYRSGDNPARWRGHLDKLLPKPRKVTKVKHFAAMAYAELPVFFSELRKRETVSARAMAFTILTAARSGETRLATADEIDVGTANWTVPEGRTKAGREHRVPLSEEALALLTRTEGVLFPNAKGKPLSDQAMLKYLQEDMGRPTLTVHGFRSAFRGWAKECTNFQWETIEEALSHRVGDATTAAYDRVEALDKRRRLMEAWAKYCITQPAVGGKVVPIRESRGRQ